MLSVPFYLNSDVVGGQREGRGRAHALLSIGIAQGIDYCYGVLYSIWCWGGYESVVPNILLEKILKNLNFFYLLCFSKFVLRYVKSY